ncbi:MAG: disulfide bond formation protein B [Gammaproteobacteria bacterium]|nr:MAG: disulfide bond formation protein B [Gammaproteobacteria bacterium]
MFSYRSLAFFGLVICTASMLFAVLYLERTLYLDPCPLCILDRVVIMALGVLFLIALLHGPRTIFAKINGVLSIVLTSIGIGLASRHIWLQNLPKDQVPECGPDLYFMLDTLPLFETLKKTLTGSGSCADTSWTFADLTIPEQTLILFVILLILSVIQTLRARKPL